jgi:hypothetical protein
VPQESVQGLPPRDRQPCPGRLRQLPDVERIAPGLTGDHLRQPRGRGCSTQKVRGESAGVRRGQRADRQVGHQQGRRRRRDAADRPQGRAVGVLAPVAHQHQEGRRVGRVQQLLQQDHAVRVPPLEVVHEHDQGPAVAEPGEQLAQGPETAAPRFPRVGRFAPQRRRRRDRRHPPQDGEQPGQRRHVPRQEGRRLRGRQLGQVPAQGVDDSVERLVREQFLLVAPAGQRHRPVLRQAVQEGADEGRLARARRAVDPDTHRRPPPDRGERLLQDAEMVVPAEEPQPRVRPVGPRRLVRLGRHPEPAPDLGPCRPPGRVAAEQVQAQPLQVRRHPRAPAGRRWRIGVLLVAEDGVDRPGERQAAGEQLVEHDPDGVPVGGRGKGRAGRLLRGHVRGRAGHQVRGGLVEPVRAQLAGEAEVEQDDPPGGSDQDVRRLHVAVQHPGGVQGGDPGRQLAERLAEPGRRLGPQRSGVRSPRWRGGGPPDVRAEFDPVQEFHSEKASRPTRDQVAQGDEVRVSQAGHHAELLLEPVQRGRRQPLQGLQGDHLAGGQVPGAVHHAHAALADLFQQFIIAQTARRLRLALRGLVVRGMRVGRRIARAGRIGGRSGAVVGLRVGGERGAVVGPRVGRLLGIAGCSRIDGGR